MSAGNKNAYEMLASQVSDYVQAHLDEKMTLDDLAHHVGVSKYHLNRLFQAATGFQLGEFMQRRGMQAAYALLAKGNCTVIDASLAAGYQSHSAFSRAFLNAFGCKPSQIKIGAAFAWRTPDTIKKICSRDISLQPEMLTLPIRQYRGLCGVGFQDSSFMALGNSLFNELGKLLHEAGLGELLTNPIGVSQDNPWQGDQTESRFFLGIADEGLPAQLALDNFIWREGTWARFYHTGSYGLMWQTISRIYAGWIVPARIILRDDAIVQAYLISPKNTAETALITALYFPVDLDS